jgi:hypothetical protein
MSKATFDLFDAPLGDAYGYFQDLLPEARFPNYHQRFCTDPQIWEQFEPPSWVFNLSWREYRYADFQLREDLNQFIPEDDPGIYIFYARPNRLLYGFPKFALYVGISNERNSHRPLRERLKDYVPGALSTIKKRTNIHRMLQLYYEQIWVAFALSSASSSQLEEIEMLLHGFIYPCFGRRDFPAAVKKVQQAFGGI